VKLRWPCLIVLEHHRQLQHDIRTMTLPTLRFPLTRPQHRLVPVARHLSQTGPYQTAILIAQIVPQSPVLTTHWLSTFPLTAKMKSYTFRSAHEVVYPFLVNSC
jgi:hypothetical protein